MTTLTIDLQDDSAIQRGINLLQRLLGNANIPAAPGSTKAPAVEVKKDPAPAVGPTAAATTASSTTPADSAAVTFDDLKRAFLGLSTKPNGRALCEGVLKPLGLAKLSDAKPEQYAGLLDAVKAAAK